MREPKLAAFYFALVFGAGFVLGAIRVPLLVPRLGARWAELLEMPLMLVVIVWSARFVVRRFAVPAGARHRLGFGVLALGLLLAAEFALAVLLQEQSLRQYLAGRDPVSGAAYGLLLIVFALMPWCLGRR